MYPASAGISGKKQEGKMKKIMLFCMCCLFALPLCGCANREVLERLDTLECQVEQLSETVAELNAVLEASAPAAAETPEPVLATAPEPKSELSYATITDLLGKANVMDGMDDRFIDGGISVSAEEYFIFLHYDGTFTSDVVENMNRVLRQGYQSKIEDISEGFGGDGDYLSFGEEENGTLYIGFELASIETASKIYQLDKEYFSSYEEFGLTQDVLDEYGIPEPLHMFNFIEDGSIYVSLDWQMGQTQTEQISAYYAKQLLGQDDFSMDGNNVHIEGTAADGTKLVFVANDYGSNYGVSIRRICKEA